MHPKPDKKNLNSIQTYRCFAVVLVALFHGTSVTQQRYPISPFNDFFSFGFSGLYLFFVISGFIIAYAHRKDVNKPRRIGYYLKRRSARIYPLYWILLLFFGAWRFHKVGLDLKDIIYNGLFFTARKSYIIPVSWTMHWELLFYLFFISFLISRNLGIILSCMWAYFITFPPKEALGHILHPFSYLFLFGLLAYAVSWYVNTIIPSKRTPIGNISLILGIISFVVAAKNYNNDGGDPDRWASDASVILKFGFACLFIVMGSLSDTVNNVLFKIPFLSLIGDASYSVYLTHVQSERIAIDLFNMINTRYLRLEPSALISNSLLVFSLFMAIAVGVMTYRFIEKPILIFLRNKIHHTT